MAHRSRRSGTPDCKPVKDFVLTPQAFSTSNLALGPVLHCSGNYSLSTNRKKTTTEKIKISYLYQLQEFLPNVMIHNDNFC